MKLTGKYVSLKKAHSIHKAEHDVEMSSRSPSRRPNSSRKYVRDSIPEQNPLRVYKC